MPLICQTNRKKWHTENIFGDRVTHRPVLGSETSPGVPGSRYRSNNNIKQIFLGLSSPNPGFFMARRDFCPSQPRICLSEIVCCDFSKSGENFSGICHDFLKGLDWYFFNYHEIFLESDQIFMGRPVFFCFW